MNKAEKLAFLAGAMDSDGCYSIKKDSHVIKTTKTNQNPTYYAVLSLKQVTPQIPKLLHGVFGGHIGTESPQTKNSKQLHRWGCSNRIAVYACEKLLPYTLVKTDRIKCILELQKTNHPKYRRLSYWYDKENPNWQRTEMVTAHEAEKILGYKHKNQIYSSMKNGTILSIGKDHEPKGVPIEFLKIYMQLYTNKVGGKVRPQQLTEWRHRIWLKMRELNKRGI